MRAIFKLNIGCYSMGVGSKDLNTRDYSHVVSAPVFLYFDKSFNATNIDSAWERQGPNSLVWSQMSDYLSEMRDLT